LNLPGAHADGVLYLRDADDALHLKERLNSAQTVVVIGGGFIGLEVAASASNLGKSVAVLCQASRLMGQAVGERTSQFFAGQHLDHGVDLRVNTGVRSIVEAQKRAAPNAAPYFVTPDTDTPAIPAESP
jgi:3-phenylpropionate/trans-cinnamate dioxygenase ferredoxin reductase subunit